MFLVSKDSDSFALCGEHLCQDIFRITVQDEAQQAAVTCLFKICAEMAGLSLRMSIANASLQRARSHRVPRLLPAGCRSTPLTRKARTCAKASINDKQARCLEMHMEGQQRLSLGQHLTVASSTIQ